MFAGGAETGGGTRAAHVSFPRISRSGCDRHERDLHTAGDTLRDSLGYGGDVATRDNTPRDTVSHSMLRLRAGAHESGRPAREIVPGGPFVSAPFHTCPPRRSSPHATFPGRAPHLHPEVQMTRVECSTGKSTLIP